MKKLLSTASLTIAAAAALSALVAPSSGAGVSQQYTTYDHPALPCHLSEEAVANWGETSAHLPQACTYGPAHE